MQAWYNLLRVGIGLKHTLNVIANTKGCVIEILTLGGIWTKRLGKEFLSKDKPLAGAQEIHFSLNATNM